MEGGGGREGRWREEEGEKEDGGRREKVKENRMNQVSYR